MSIQAIAAVWDFPVTPQEKLVLLVMADHADERGGSVFPSVARIMQMSGLSERVVQRTTGGLIEVGLIEVVRAAQPGRPTEYRILIEGVERMPLRTPRPVVESCPRWLRSLVKEAFALTCAYCERVGTETLGPDGALWTIDRLVPGSKGGHYVPANVALACRSCNGSKQTKHAGPEALARIGAKMAPYVGANSPVETAPDPSGSISSPERLDHSEDHDGLGAISAPSPHPGLVTDRRAMFDRLTGATRRR